MRILLWVSFAIFVVVAFWAGTGEKTFSLDVPLAGAKVAVWVVLLGFLAYTIYCSSREDLFGTLRRILQYHWGRQVTLDLYIGISLFLFIVYLNDGPITMLLWLLPAIAFVNLASLVYLAIHFDSLVARFL